MANPAEGSSRVSAETADAFITASRALVGLAVRSINTAPVEITVAQHRVLVLLATGGAQTVGELATQLGVNASNASRLCDRLQKLHLVARTRSARDGRAVEVSLTESGRTLLEAVRRTRQRDVQRLLGRMAPADVDCAIRALDAFSTAAQEADEAAWATHAV